MRFLRRWRWTITASLICAAAITLLVFLAPHKPWWWLPAIFGGALINNIIADRRKTHRARQNTMFPGGLPCPPECRTRGPHTHEKL